jgi:hypothetical protein
MARRALCVGINNYPGTQNDLKGCVNDARDWASLLTETFGFRDVELLLDSQATRKAIKKKLGELASKGRAGDVLVFTYSGHGTHVPDVGEQDEADRRDEAICAHDGNITDDELRKIIRDVPAKARLTVISDSCHSGTVTRQMLQRDQDARELFSEEGLDYAPKPRFMPPPDWAPTTRGLPAARGFLYPEKDMSELLLTGCTAGQLSYDAYLSGRYNGAMSATAIRLIKRKPDQTYREFHQRLRQLLPTPRFPQSPQLEGSDEFKDLKLFTSEHRSESGPADADVPAEPGAQDVLDMLDNLFVAFASRAQRKLRK